jgi:hypothetical protein
MTLLPPVGNGKRDQICPAKGQLKGFAHLISDFINSIDPKRTSREAGDGQGSSLAVALMRPACSKPSRA